MTLTDIRTSLQQYLQDQLSIRFVSGVVEGPVEDQSLGCVWTTGGARRDDAESEDVTMHVRVFLRWDPAEPKLRDPAALELLVDQVKTLMKPIQSGLADAWYFQVPQWEIDLETNGCEIVVTAIRTDPFATGG